ncbi:kinesin-like protein KIF2A isoform X2 [Frankliniella occidentalis]|uniref:Kinesin-like protein n=1 Tax=Frankliniella occidentalis TaxID=133901 RepID=A0A9C6TXA0_FRAOC|nr:kinesin-like protein KIF2A isoform X2 [Frankliniella occidentalis]
MGWLSKLCRRRGVLGHSGKELPPSPLPAAEQPPLQPLVAAPEPPVAAPPALAAPKAAPEADVDDDCSTTTTSGRNKDRDVPGGPAAGRVHSAIVSGVNWETRSVTVEWFERGETKGKEIEMEAILNMNTHLMGTAPQDEPVINNNKKVTRSTKANNPTMSVASSKAPYRSTRNQGRPTNIVPAVNGHGDSGIPVPNRVCETVAPTPTNPSAPRHTMQLSTAPVATAPTGRSVKGGGGLIETAVQNQNQNIGPAGVGGVGGAGAANNAANNRRSNVVKEVERLKKNREERRQRQAELKEEKEALMNLDPGNPNWEFLAMIREYRNAIDFRPLRGSESVEDHQITVCVRKRPLNKKEMTRKEVDVITIPSRDQLVVHEPKNKVDLTKYLENAPFRFDYAFDEYCGNEIVYKYTAQPLVQTIFEGGMATCFAYGQTGSGKTHTMGGDFQGKTQDCKKGIYAMAAKDVFKYLKSSKYAPLNLVISASFFEIYSGKVFDLLADKAKLRVLEDGKQQVQIVGLTEQVVGSVEDVLKLIQHGNAARTSGQTSANSNSSRSHAVFQIVARTPGTHRVHGKFSLIDLAGNERGADTSSANRQTRMEGAEINKSLLSLKECIRALGRKNAHLPFRASKLTQVLRDSFIGEKSKTCMIAMISPGLSSCEHSLNTLRYADRVKELAANGPSENKASPEQDRESPTAEDGGLDDSDLAQLRSLNEGELSADLYNFHEAVSQLQMMEDEVLDTHKSVLEASQRWHEMDCRLLADTRDVDYDQDAYASNLEALVSEKIETLMQFREKITAFRGQLLAEEKISQKMNRAPMNSRHH